MKKHIDAKEYPVNVVYKYEKEDSPFYLILHHAKDIPLRE